MAKNEIFTTFAKKFIHNKNNNYLLMKKIILITPFALLVSFFSFIPNLKAAGCSSHNNKNVQVECSASDDNCDNDKLNKKFNKVEA